MNSVSGGRRPCGGRRGAWIVALLLTASPLGAQEITIKRVLLAAGADGCAFLPAAARAQPLAAERQQAQALLAAGQQALLVGDHAAARRHLAEAARLDPHDSEINYHHARLLEEVGDVGAAAEEYCRFLAQHPGSSDAAEVRGRLDSLAGAAAARPPADAVAQFRYAVGHYERGDLRAAERALSHVITHAPSLPEPYFNRAIVQWQAGQAAGASRDLESYRRLAPEAADADEMLRRIAGLRRRGTSPGVVLTTGLLVPGLGQISTGRPALGLLVMAGAGAVLAVAVQPEEVERRAVFRDPFGNAYEESYTAREYPHLVSGVVGALAISALAATEAFLFARRSQREARAGVLGSGDGARLVPYIAVAAEQLGFGLSLPTGGSRPGKGGTARPVAPIGSSAPGGPSGW